MNKEEELVSWLAKGYIKHRNIKNMPSRARILEYSQNRTYWLDWQKALKTAVETERINDNMVLSYANGIYRRVHPDCPSASFVSNATRKAIRKGKSKNVSELTLRNANS